jgi:hypothetical protein
LALDPYVPAVAPLAGRIELEIVPTKFDEFKFEIPDPFEMTARPDTVNPVRVPTEVTLG